MPFLITLSFIFVIVLIDYTQIIESIDDMIKISTILIAISAIIISLGSLFVNIKKSERDNSIASGNIFLTFKKSIFENHLDIYKLIIRNYRENIKNPPELVGYDKEKLFKFLFELETISMLSKKSVLDFDMVFDYFGALFLAIKVDKNVIDFINIRRKNNNKKLIYYKYLEDIINKCSKENYGKNHKDMDFNI